MPRITWDNLPETVRRQVEGILGSPVVSHTSHATGFSPGTADRVVCRDGRVAFVKAVHPRLNARTPELHRAEARIMAAMPGGLPVPRWIGGFERDDWVVLVLEYLDGTAHPDLPWAADQFSPVLDACFELSERLTPSPLPDLPKASDELGGMWRAFGRLSEAPPPGLDPWLHKHLPRLHDAARRNLALLDGDTLTHCDLRADNILVGTDGQVWFIDWPWALLAAPWLDAALLTANFAQSGDPAATDVFLRRIAEHFDVSPALGADALAGLLGFCVEACSLPAEPGVATVRDLQRRIADGLTAWAKESTLLTLA